MFDDEYDIEDGESYDDNEDVMNSSLFKQTDVGAEYRATIFGNTNLKHGIVIKIYEIDDKKNMNKKFPEYDVLIVEQSGTSSISPVIYKNCISVDGFGGVADFFEFKIRPSKEKEGDKQAELDVDFKNQFGNMVLMLCLDGVSDKGIIIKSISHAARKTKLTKDAGLHLEGEYNGLNWQINKDGEFTITYRSKTSDKGEVKEGDKTGGTHIKMDKEGSVDVNTNLEGDDETYIRMDKKNKDVGIKAGQHIGFTAKKNIAQIAEGNITAKAKAMIEFAAEGSAKYTSKSSLDIEGTSAVNIKGGDIIMEAQNGVMIKGTQVIIEASTVLVGSGAVPAVVPTTQFIGTGNHGAPVVCDAVGPYSGTVSIAV